MTHTSLKAVLKQTQQQLIKEKTLTSDLAKLEAQLLLQHVLNVNQAWLISHENDALEANVHAEFEALLHRRLNGEPIAYILGEREFYGLKLKVSTDTLIPRPDTETLVEAALSKIPQDINIRILDLGTGTGAIALAIAKHRPQAFIYAVDASQAALDVAIENARNLGISNVAFILSDWFSALNQDNSMQKFDVIVSNPPYIETDDTHLTQGDLRYEPIKALASGVDGLDAIRTIITNASQHLNPHGWLMLEHGYNQAESVASLLKQAGFTEINHAKDLAGIQRVTLGRLA